MSDIMRPLAFSQIMNRIFAEYRESESIFGVRKIVQHTGENVYPIFDEKVETPFGPAAGPHTQLAQNIISAYAAGARFFELKTVQVMDGAELSACVNKPCILAKDEGYNCEWSTELTVPDAFNEYVKAWVALKLIAKEFGFGSPDGFVFNMSVGYDLDGIKTEKIDRFLTQMKDAGETEIFRECISWAKEHLDLFTHVDADYVDQISPCVSRSVTESTLHGCPPDEIERIASYLLTEKHLHTFIKCNPTLLGYDYARKRLDALGFDYVAFDDHHFREDLQWEDAIPMLRRLREVAAKEGLSFGVKLTNTFPVDVRENELPSEEMYMSGRSLFPLSIHLARMLSEEFEGKLRISYSGGADLRNTKELVRAGIFPVTQATNILKPGGYDRFAQIYYDSKDLPGGEIGNVDVAALARLDDAVEADAFYHKSVKPLPERHTGKQLPLFDCFDAPCRSGCPIGQDIPAYLEAMVNGDAKKALSIILERNALPFITGTICPHHCGDKCMRNYYEETLHIRETKLAAARAAYADALAGIGAPLATADKRVAVIGGGPAGLSAAYFLSRAGIPVTVFEKRESFGGVVRHVIPSFRISDADIEKDVALCKAYGAEFVTGKEITDVKALFHEGYSDVLVCCGAWKEGEETLSYGESMDALEFLETLKRDPGKIPPCENVVVIGGGNTAMDTARAAKRLPGVKNVRLVYRRTKRYMPADEEELHAALNDGVEFMELLAPVGLKDHQLTCDVCELGAPDASGRRSPVATGEKMTIDTDLVIAAVGERVDTALYENAGAAMSEKGRIVVDENMQTSVPHLYAAGDCRRGPATVVEAIADAMQAAAAIAGIRYDKEETADRLMAPDIAFLKKGAVERDLSKVPDRRCLGCSTVCGVCEDVCPNRANLLLRVPGKQMMQVLHLDGMCNECGNCAVFCPYAGRPYKDKFTLFSSKEDFEDSENEGFLCNADGTFTVRLDQSVLQLEEGTLDNAGKDAAELIRTVVKNYKYLI